MSACRYGMDYAGCPDENPQGDWVRYEDYAELERQVLAYQIRVDNDALRLRECEIDMNCTLGVVEPKQVY
jgi:hypothetical protein